MEHYKLVREEDGLIKASKDIIWMEWNEDRTFKSSHHEIKNGRSLVMSPLNFTYTWMTTTVISFEILGDVIKFKTQNSTYTLTKEETE